jgi:hypothetical protein
MQGNATITHKILHSYTISNTSHLVGILSLSLCLSFSLMLLWIELRASGFIGKYSTWGMPPVLGGIIWTPYSWSYHATVLELHVKFISL